MNILVVDDESDVKTLFEQRFRKEIRTGETHFAFATSGEEALNYLNSPGHDSALILSDINMPGMGGLELLKKVREKHLAPSPIVILITAYGDQENYNKAMTLGANDFLTKPVDFSCLKKKLKSQVCDQIND
jgi:CheY-like chemotaxis protein